MYDLSVRLFGKAAIKETGVLPVVRFLGLRALRTSLPLICKSIDQGIAESHHFKRVPRPNIENERIGGK